jgi:hypothetical protein
MFKLHCRTLLSISRWSGQSAVPEPLDSTTRSVVGESERDYAPDAIHLFPVLIYKCGDCVG